MNKLVLFISCLIFQSLLFINGSRIYSQEVNSFETLGRISNFIDYSANEESDNAFKILLYTINLNNYSFPIELVYNSSGIRYMDQPSEVGFGWKLDLGYIINRQVNGLPDESLPCPPESLPNQGGVVPSIGSYGIYGDEINWGGWLRCSEIDLSQLIHNNLLPPSDHVKRMINKYLLHNVYDIKPDEFTLNLRNESFDFFFTKSGQIRYLESPNFLMQPNLLNVNENKFIVTDKNGITFSFIEGIVEETNWSRYISSTRPDYFVEPFYPSFSSEFNLRSIEFPNGQSVKYHYREDKRAKINLNKTIYYEPDNPYSQQEGEMTTSNSVIVQKRSILDSIVTQTEKIQFLYEEYNDPTYAQYGNDYYPTNTGNQHRLIAIVVKDYLGREVKRILFTYDTYYDLKTRLRTISLVSGEDTILLRQFSYDSQLDNSHSFNRLNQDCYGYYNTNSQSHIFPYVPNGIPANRSYDPERIYAGMLNKIVFETGGLVEIEYSPKIFETEINNNTYIFYGGGVVPKKYTYYDSEYSSLYSRIYNYFGLKGVYQDISSLKGYSSGKPEGSYGVLYGYNIFLDQTRQEITPLFRYDDFDEYTRRRGSFYSRIEIKTIGKNDSQNGTIVTNYEPSKNKFSYSPKKVKETFFKEGEQLPILTVNYSYNDNFQELNKILFVDHEETVYSKLFHIGGLATYIYNFFTIPRYFYYSIDERLSGKEVVKNTENGQIIESSSYQYDSKGFLVEQTDFTSLGEEIKTKKTYPHSYSIDPIVLKDQSDEMTVGLYRMTISNMLNYNVESYTSINSIVREGNLILYSYHPNSGIVLPKKQFKLGNIPLTPSENFGSFVSRSLFTWSFNYSQNYYCSVTNDDFDHNGNLVQFHLEDSIPNSNLWDYTGQHLIAKILNASYDKVAFTSFEFGFDKGGWNYNENENSNAYDFNTFRNGISSFIMYNGGYHINKSLVPGNYYLSYWLKGGSVIVSGGTIEDVYESEPDDNGWIMFIKKIIIPNQTSQDISVSLGDGGPNVRIDDLRLHPIDAQMTTYTHNPLVGVTSITDPNNRTTYYEYDGLGRLKTVKDEDGNILKHHEYKYYDQVDE